MFLKNTIGLYRSVKVSYKRSFFNTTAIKILWASLCSIILSECGMGRLVGIIANISTFPTRYYYPGRGLRALVNDAKDHKAGHSAKTR